MNYFISAIFLLGIICPSLQENINLPDLDPQDAQQIIEQQDNSLKYAPKVDSNVPAVRYLGNEKHNVVEDIYLANQYHGQDGLGGYLYGYSVPDIAKTEKKKAGGDLRGAYNYIAGNGQEIKVEYWDDGTGFHQIDNVPKNLPEDLPAVKAEKERFLKRWHEEAERNSRPVEDPYNSEGQYKEGPLSVQGQLQRQQQFAAQFGKAAAYKQPEGSASQQSGVYQSNLAAQTYNANYQPYQGKDQQNQGAYQSKHSSAYTQSPQASTGYGQSQIGGGYGSAGNGGYGGQASGGYGQGQSAYGGQAGYGSGSAVSQGSGGYGGSSGGSSGYGAQRPATSSGYGGAAGYGGQVKSTPSGYGSSGGYGSQPSGGASAYGGQGSSGQSGSGAYGAKPPGYGSQGASGYGGQGASGYGGQGASGYGNSGGYSSQPSGGSSAYGVQTSPGYGGSSGYGAKPSSSSSGYGGQTSSGYGQTSGGYLGQPSQNVNKYAPVQTSSYGQAQTYGKYTSNPGQEDDGSYKPENDEEQGPPRGFFYKFDYPVGIIVSKQGPAQGVPYGQAQSGGYQDKQKAHGSY